MLKNAPKFYEVAKRIVEITEDCIFVAHNADFDYRILKTEFKRLGFEYNRRTLCTVELSQALLPDMESYSLGKLSRSLGIAVSDRHRATGDAMATVKLFKLLLEKDLEKVIIQNAIKTEQRSRINPNLKSILEELPSETGVYYIHNDQGDIIYIGKSRNIKKRLTQHFTGQDSKSKKLQLQVYAVTYEKTGSELVALLKENEEIKKIKPFFNRALKKSVFSYALYSFYDQQGYLNFKIDKANLPDQSPVTTFVNRQGGLSFLNRITEEFGLCEKLNHMRLTKHSCFKYDLKTCNGACILEETPQEYNMRAQEVINQYGLDTKDLIIVDRGRDLSEKSVILIEEGIFKGLGFIDLNYQISNKMVLHNVITPMSHNKDTQHIIQYYIRRNKKRLKLITP